MVFVFMSPEPSKYYSPSHFKRKARSHDILQGDREDQAQRGRGEGTFLPDSECH